MANTINIGGPMHNYLVKNFNKYISAFERSIFFDGYNECLFLIRPPGFQLAFQSLPGFEFTYFANANPAWLLY